MSLFSEENGKFPDYPSDEEGGSAVVFNPELRAKLLGEGETWERESNSSDEESGGGGASNKKGKGSDDKKASSKDEKAGGSSGAGGAAAGAGDKKGAAGKEEEDEAGYRLGRSEFVKGLRAADKEFYGKDKCFMFEHMCVNLSVDM